MEVEKKPWSGLSDVSAWAMNVISSVGVIMANKQLMSSHGYDFTYATTITGCNFFLTALVGAVSNVTGYSTSKHIPQWELLWFSIVANMSVTGLNLSLMQTNLQTFLLFSCFLAVFCNISQYLCTGRFSAVSFQVLGHMKTVCVLTLGWLLFDLEMTSKNITGMLIALVGMVVCSWAVELEKQAKIASQDIEKGLTDEDVRLLREGV